MALKSLIVVSLLVVGLAALLADAQSIGNLLGLIRIQGTVYCTANGGIGVNGTRTPVFPNALVQLQCGSGNVVASGITNGRGIFSIFLDPIQFILSSVLSNCTLVVNTPLSTCNSSLPVGGTLSSTIQFVGRSVTGLLTILNLVPAGFTLLIN